MGSVSSMHGGHRNEHEGSTLWRIGQLQSAYRWRVLCFDNVGLLHVLCRHPQIFVPYAWWDRCQTHTTRYRTASTKVRGNEENYRRHRQCVSHSRHCVTILSVERPPEPADVSATVYRVLSVQHGHVLKRHIVYMCSLCVCVCMCIWHCEWIQTLRDIVCECSGGSGTSKRGGARSSAAVASIQTPKAPRG